MATRINENWKRLLTVWKKNESILSANDLFKLKAKSIKASINLARFRG